MPGHLKPVVLVDTTYSVRHRPIVRTFENTVLATWRQVPDPQVQVDVL